VTNDVGNAATSVFMPGGKRFRFAAIFGGGKTLGNQGWLAQRISIRKITEKENGEVIKIERKIFIQKMYKIFYYLKIK